MATHALLCLCTILRPALVQSILHLAGLPGCFVEVLLAVHVEQQLCRFGPCRRPTPCRPGIVHRRLTIVRRAQGYDTGDRLPNDTAGAQLEVACSHRLWQSNGRPLRRTLQVFHVENRIVAPGARGVLGALDLESDRIVRGVPHVGPQYSLNCFTALPSIKRNRNVISFGYVGDWIPIDLVRRVAIREDGHGRKAICLTLVTRRHSCSTASTIELLRCVVHKLRVDDSSRT